MCLMIWCFYIGNFTYKFDVCVELTKEARERTDSHEIFMQQIWWKWLYCFRIVCIWYIGRWETKQQRDSKEVALNGLHNWIRHAEDT